jgi:hypothetical protein
VSFFNDDPYEPRRICDPLSPRGDSMQLGACISGFFRLAREAARGAAQARGLSRLGTAPPQAGFGADPAAPSLRMAEEVVAGALSLSDELRGEGPEWGRAPRRTPPQKAQELSHLTSLSPRKPSHAGMLEHPRGSSRLLRLSKRSLLMRPPTHTEHHPRGTRGRLAVQ